MLAYISRLALVVVRAAQMSATPSSALALVECNAWVIALAVNFSFRGALTTIADVKSLQALVSALHIPTVRMRDAPRLVSRSPNRRHNLTNIITADPLEPLANLSLSHDGSLIAPSPPATPSAHNRPAQSARGKPDDRNRRLSFPSLFRTREIGASTPPRPNTFTASYSSLPPDQPAGADVIAASAEEPMDWCPTPPQQASSAASNSFDSPLALRTGSVSSSNGNHVTFARQRFVPPDTRKPTGLEGMFDRLVTVRDGGAEARTAEAVAGQDVEMRQPQGGRTWLGWWR